jgi:hypothetical protein
MISKPQIFKEILRQKSSFVDVGPTNCILPVRKVEIPRGLGMTQSPAVILRQ